MAMATPMLELVRQTPDWMNALGVALTRPPGVPERRERTDIGAWPPPASRPRRISDDLAWLRQAMDEPDENGLRALDSSAAVAAWETVPESEAAGRLGRLRDRGVLDAAGFLLHEPEPEFV